MSNNTYILQLEEADTDKPQVKDNTLGVSDQQIPKKTKPKPKVKIQGSLFTFFISPIVIDYGTLSPTNPILRSNKLSVSGGLAPQLTGYSVIAFEDKELSTAATSDVGEESSAFIPDTTCDNGQCSESSSSPWTNPLTYGFGYRCDNVLGSHCGSEFSNTEFYKQFANTSMSEAPQKVASGTNAKKEKTVRITYKINIPIAQPFAFYSNTITYIAVPNF